MAASPDPPAVTLPPIATDKFFDGVKLWLKKFVVSGERPSISEKMKVIDCVERTIDLAPPDCVYIALSYVWGTNQACPSLKGELPQTIEDSITTVLHLGYRYLWVNRYCIDQEAESKHVQIQQMGAVYAGATMTIIAYAGAEPTYGLPGVSKKLDRTINWYVEQVIGYVGVSTWFRRGWTFQDNYLSKRRLFFTEIGLAFTCESSFNSEFTCHQTSLFEVMLRAVVDNQRRLGGPTDSEMALFEAANIMESYSTRQLSYESDVLNAIVGVLNTLSTRQFPVRHIWGVPFLAGDTENRNIATIALNWVSSDPGTRRSAFPSWSSLGWTSSKKFPVDTNCPYPCSGDFNLKVYQKNKFQDIREIEEGCQYAHSVAPKSQHLQITAYSVLLDASLWIDPPNGQSPHGIILPVTDNFVFHIRPHWDDKQCALKPDTSVLCVFQSALSCCGLILQRHGEYYERVGCFTMDKRLDPSLFHCCTEELCDKSLPGKSEATVASKSGPIKRQTIELR